MKIFCIGRNKTGTTSLEIALKSLGFRMGNQAQGEMLLDDWARRDFRRIVTLCKTADAFQDVPFSMPWTFQALDLAFPGSRFILTVRDTPDDWYQSLIRFHTKIVGKCRIPTADDLRDFNYRYKGFLWRSAQINYGVNEHTLYNKELYTGHYMWHNQMVMNYFVFRPQDLLVLNLKDSESMLKLCNFLQVPYTGQSMPHENKSG
ncbi:MAG: sulfotransferase [Candidatus Nitrotoga sp.]